MFFQPAVPFSFFPGLAVLFKVFLWPPFGESPIFEWVSVLHVDVTRAFLIMVLLCRRRRRRRRLQYYLSSAVRRRGSWSLRRRLVSD